MEDFTLITTTDSNEVIKYQKSIARSDVLAVDTETSGLNCFNDKLLLIQVKCADSVYILDCTKLKPNEIDYLMSFLDTKDKIKIFHNAKFDLKFINQNTNDRMLTNVYDTMLAESLLNAGLGGKESLFSSLDSLTKKYCDYEMDKNVRKQFHGADSVNQEMLVYSAIDVNFLHDIRLKQLENIYSQNLEKVLDLEMSLIPVVANSEIRGITLDTDSWLELAENAKSKMEEKELEIKRIIADRYFEIYPYEELEAPNGYLAFEHLKMAFPSKAKKYFNSLKEITSPEAIKEIIIEHFNVGSPYQLKEAFLLWGIEIPDTQKQTLESSEYAGPLSDTILEFRKYYKRVTTYGEAYLDNIEPATGKLHPEANQIGTHTGRFSYDGPNIQQVPTDKVKYIENGEEKERAIYRNCFVAGEGKKLITADYSQAELRIAGALSGEESIINAYQKDLDIHAQTAADIYHKDIEDVTSKERDRAKTLNFSILYGATPHGVSAKNPEIPYHEAVELLDRFFEVRPGLTAFIEGMGDAVLESYYSITPLGRIRRFEKRTIFDEDWGYKWYTGKVKREGVNHVIQGASADSIKIAMCMMYYENPFGKDKFNIIMTIHDEVVVEVDEGIAEDAKTFVVSCMEQAEDLFLEGLVPAKVEADISDRWEK